MIGRVSEKMRKRQTWVRDRNGYQIYLYHYLLYDNLNQLWFGCRKTSGDIQKRLPGAWFTQEASDTFRRMLGQGSELPPKNWTGGKGALKPIFFYRGSRGVSSLTPLYAFDFCGAVSGSKKGTETGHDGL